MSSYTQANRPMAIQSPLGPDVLLLTGLKGREGISELFHFELQLLVEQPRAVAFDQILGQSVTVELDASGRREAVRQRHRQPVPAGRPGRDVHPLPGRGRPEALAPDAQGEEQDLPAPHGPGDPLEGLQRPRRQDRGQRHVRAPRLLHPVSRVRLRLRFPADGGGGNPVLLPPFQRQPPARRHGRRPRASRPPRPERGLLRRARPRRRAGRDEGDLLGEVAGGPIGHLHASGTTASSCRGRISRRSSGHSRAYPWGRSPTSSGSSTSRSRSTTSRAATRSVSTASTRRARRGRPTSRRSSPTGSGRSGSGWRWRRCSPSRSDGTSYCRHFAPGFAFTISRHFDADGRYLITRVEHEASLEGDYRSGGDAAVRLPERVPLHPCGTRVSPRAGDRQAGHRGQPDGDRRRPAGRGDLVRPLRTREGPVPLGSRGKKDPSASCWIRVAQPWAGKAAGASSSGRVPGTRSSSRSRRGTPTSR